MEGLKNYTLQKVKVQVTEERDQCLIRTNILFCAQSVSNPVGFKRACLTHYDSYGALSLERSAIGSI